MLPLVVSCTTGPNTAPGVVEWRDDNSVTNNLPGTRFYRVKTY